jgi:hypothetical protein
VPSGSAHADLHFLEPPKLRQTSRSAPTTPQLTPEHEHFPLPASPRAENAFSLKRSLSKRNQSKTREQKGEERKEVEYNQPTLSTGRAEASSRTPDLASELNELAVAHKEGLLGEDEYRMLRQNVFEKMMGKGEMEMPREGRVHGISRKGNGVAAAKEDDSSVFSGSTSMRSKRSSTSKLASLFKRESRSELRGDLGSSSLLSANGSIHSGAATSMRSRLSTSATMETQISQARRARTLQSGISVQGVEASSSSSSSLGKSGLLSVERGGYSAPGASISSGNALLGANYTDKSADEIDAEIAVVEAEGHRILERFKSLQIDTMGRYNLSYEMLKRALEGIGLEAEVEAEVFEDYVLIEGGAEGANGQMNGNRNTLSSRIRRKRSIGSNEFQATISGRRGKNRGDSTLAPSSYKAIPRQPLPSSFTPPSDTPSNGYNVQSDEEDAELVKLRAELKEIVRRRSEVAKKYADRLAFLRSTLRSAKIRQGLR